ncbi:NADPH:quinone oxidoreductase family protein [Paracoccus sp. (in: a-proteobacteria)]|uniref:NADPH:quinone oxidoreductase family protein n=1 Tax=Paracoccus sp. TaxID=267 RepID=UPI0026E0BCFE|nr:NADPH:quinone oxidoreductase family protein [Paracoccus sp. (in: a-proteobacteria)]MDO5371082.1 NADPH:quinone oxidoreductase family protein [Paracoccus sp. (in: a-proteobacteria)]
MTRIINIAGPGAAPFLTVGESRDPGPGEVRLRLHAAALNFADLLMAEGKYQDTPPYPFVAGIEGAGVVEAAGPGVALATGTRVSVSGHGTLADHGVFPADDCIPIPDRMSWREAAGFQVAYGTSHLALTGPARLQAGETLAVLGAGGGVGLTAVEIGAALGARVIAVARGADKLDAARQAGAAETIDSGETEDLKAALRGFGGVDVVYDAVGDAPGLTAFGALRTGGRHLLIGFAGGRPPALPLNHALVKNIAIFGFYWGGYRQLDRLAMRASLEAALRMYDEGRLHPTAGAVLPLERAAEAYELLRARKAIGKVILTMTGEAVAG